MAPEIVKRADYLGPPTDVYALGVVLFTMLCGRFPFTAATYPELYRKISRGRFPVPSHVSRPGADLLRRMMARDPAERPLLEQCLEHRWFAEGEERAREGPVLNPQQHISTNAEDDLLPSVLDDVASLGVDAVSTSEAVLTRTHNHFSTTYYLQLRRTLFRHRREEVEQSGEGAGFGDLDAQPSARSHARRTSSASTPDAGSELGAAGEDHGSPAGAAASPMHAPPDGAGTAASSPPSGDDGACAGGEEGEEGKEEERKEAGARLCSPSPSVSRRGRPWSPLRRASPPGAAAGGPSARVAPPPSPTRLAVGRGAPGAEHSPGAEVSVTPPRVITGAPAFGSAVRAKQRSPAGSATAPLAVV